jgi:hypothetical protein
MDLFKEVLPSLQQKTKNLLDENPDLEKEYQPYIVNRALSFDLATLEFTQEMNKYPSLPKKMQYDFLFYGIPQGKKYTKWVKPENIEHLEMVKHYYKYSAKRAREALEILTDKDIEIIKQRTYKGEKL